MNTKKATRGQVREHNRRLILRAIHTGLANNRAALANETRLTKPTVSDLISELMEDGFLIETGHGKAQKRGGKPPRLIEFVPTARQVIGISISEYGVIGLLTDLNGKIQAEHVLNIEDDQLPIHLDDITGVINGLMAQIDAELLCIGVGVPQEANERLHIISHSIEDVQKILQDTYAVDVYMVSNIELAARAQFAIADSPNKSSLVTLLINSSVEVGYVLGNTDYQYGRNIGAMKLSPDSESLEDLIGWRAVRSRVEALQNNYPNTQITPNNIRYLTIRQAIHQHDPVAQIIEQELIETLATIFAWIITLLRPDHLILTGGIADLGQRFLDKVIRLTAKHIDSPVVHDTHISLSTDSNLSAKGAIAYALQESLGLTLWAIGIITNDHSQVFQSQVISGIMNIAERENIEVIIDSRNHGNNPTQITELDIDALEGLIIIATAVPDDFAKNLYQKLPISFVSHHLPDTPIPAVMPNNFEGIQKLVQHLVQDCNRQYFAFIDGDLSQRDGLERQQAFLKERIRHELVELPIYFLRGDFDTTIAAQSLNTFLESKPQLDALIAADYLMAIEAMRILETYGYRVPEDVAVVGFGDGEQAREHDLTTIAADIIELGRRSARQLIGQLNGLNIRGTTLLSVDLQQRASSVRE